MLNVKTVSTLEKIFSDQSFICIPELTSDIVARGERYSFQIVFMQDEWDICQKIKLKLQTDLNVKMRLVESVAVHYPVTCDMDDDVLRSRPGLFPDLLAPLPAEWGFRAGRRMNCTIWVTVEIDENTPVGKYPVTAAFERFNYNTDCWEKCDIKAEFLIEVLPFTLPESELLRYEWFHSDCLYKYYNVPCWSEEHWRIIENFASNAMRHGINVLYTPLWTPPLDTGVGLERPVCQLLDIKCNRELIQFEFGFERLERFLELGKKLGFKKFGMSHLFSQWGAKFTPAIYAQCENTVQKIFGWHVESGSPGYARFLAQLIPQLQALLKRHGIGPERCYFSLSDEPYSEHLETYSKLVDTVRPLLGEYQTLEALSKVEYFDNGLVRNPVPAINHIESFRGKVKGLWGYYCCSQRQKVPNRFIAYPSRRTRIMGVLAYVYDLTGFLHWGFNFYYSGFSHHLVNPFFRNDAELSFPGGDPFLVYPGSNGEPWDSLRHEVFFDGLQDLSALRLLEKKIGRDEVLRIINSGLYQPLSMTEYPRTEAWLRDLRSRVYALLIQKK